MKGNPGNIASENILSAHSESISLKIFRIHSPIFVLNQIVNNKMNQLQRFESKLKEQKSIVITTTGN